MSDLFKARNKVEEGADWRGDINVEIDDEVMSLTVRQLVDTEFWEIMSQLDVDEIREFQDALPEDTVEELNELRDKDDLTEEEEEKLSNLQSEIEDLDINMFDYLSVETYKAIKQAAIYGVEADEDDARYAITEYGDEIQDAYGTVDSEHAKEWANNHIVRPMMERSTPSTNFVSFTIGMKVLNETGDLGN